MGKSQKKKMWEEEAQQPDYSTIFLKAKQEHLKIDSFEPLTAIKGYEDYAIRPLNRFIARTRSLNTATRVRELIRYAFNRYRPPGFLYQVWDSEFQRQNIRIFPDIKEDFRLWFICLVQGKSLYKEHAMGLLTKKEVHYFSTCPYPLTIPEAIWYAVVLALDENESRSLARAIASTKLSSEPLTDFWKDTARWFMTHRTSVREMNDLLDYIGNRHAANAEWHLKDMTLNNLIKHMHTWHRELHRVSTMSPLYTKWEGVDVHDSTIERGLGRKRVRWKFHQITTGQELAEEGNKQRHCVSSYGARCAGGECSIWSLTQWDIYNSGIHSLTIEVRDKTVVQAKGYANRLPKAEEMSVLREWASKCGFGIRDRS